MHPAHGTFDYVLWCNVELMCLPWPLNSVCFSFLLKRLERNCKDILKNGENFINGKAVLLLVYPPSVFHKFIDFSYLYLLQVLQEEIVN